MVVIIGLVGFKVCIIILVFEIGWLFFKEVIVFWIILEFGERFVEIIVFFLVVIINFLNLFLKLIVFIIVVYCLGERFDMVKVFWVFVIMEVIKEWFLLKIWIIVFRIGIVVDLFVICFNRCLGLGDNDKSVVVVFLVIKVILVEKVLNFWFWVVIINELVGKFEIEKFLFFLFMVVFIIILFECVIIIRDLVIFFLFLILMIFFINVVGSVFNLIVVNVCLLVWIIVDLVLEVNLGVVIFIK